MWPHGRCPRCWNNLEMYQQHPTGTRKSSVSTVSTPASSTTTTSTMPICSCNNWSSTSTTAHNHQQFHVSPFSQSQQQQQSPTSSTPCRIMTSQWYTPTTATPNFFVSDTPASNSREMRNRAEKQRRDKLNSCISELATLVPMVSGSSKRMDKTSILRLTATHLRIYYTILNGQSPNTEFNDVDLNALEQLIYEQLEGFLLILTPTGKIVFISHTVEQFLGHLQTDLMGQSIYTITCAEDHDKLRVHLSLDIIDVEWRRYFNISLAKAGPRTESPTYEQFNVMGMIRPSVESRNKQIKDAAAQTSNNKIQNNVLVFFVKLYRPPPLSEMLIEATKDEYITRHLIDGRIVNCDHRISFVAGYMIEEISGLSAFRFMHKEDVRWTMIALRQMYDRGESVGWSCYRLLSRTGQFIYLRTFGYLEVDNTGVVESFVCVNTLVTEEEGKRLIKEMKERYSVMINATPNLQLSDAEVSAPCVEDPRTLDECIKHLITNFVPTSPKTENSTSPKPSALCNENEDCYTLTELPVLSADLSHTLKNNSNTIKMKRAPHHSDDTNGAVKRKRQKRRTISNSSNSSSELIMDAYQTTQDSNSPGTLILHQPGNICRPTITERMHKDQSSVYQSHNLLSHNLGM